MAEVASLKSHLDEFSSIIMDLANIEINYKNEDYGFRLLCSLPLSYKHFRNTLIYDGRETLTLKEVKAILISNKLIDKKLSTRNNGLVECLIIRGRSINRISTSSNRSKFRFKSRHKNLTYDFC